MVTNQIFRLFAICVLFSSVASAAVRIKDITYISGARSNQLNGIGVVVGLDGTGARSLATQQIAIDWLKKLGINTKIARQQLQDNVFQSESISTVIVTAELGPFAREGSRLDVRVSVFDDADSLRGGILVFTPLRGADGEVYAVAQGPVSIASQGELTDHLNSGKIPNGAIVEKEALGHFHVRGYMRLMLREPDYSTAKMIARAINERFAHSARAVDAGLVDVSIPKSLSNRASDFASEIGQLMVEPDATARVVIDESTGTVVVSGNVQISAVGITHANFRLDIAPPAADDPFGPAGALLGIPPEPDPNDNAAIARNSGVIRGQQFPGPGQLPGPGGQLQGPGRFPGLGQLQGQGQEQNLNIFLPPAPQPTFPPEVFFFPPPEDQPVLNPPRKFDYLRRTTTVADLVDAMNRLGVGGEDLITIFQALSKAGALHAEIVNR